MKKILAFFSVFIVLFFQSCSYQSSPVVQNEVETGMDSLENKQEEKSMSYLSAKELKNFFTEQKSNTTVIVQPKSLSADGDGVYCYFRLNKGKATSLRLRIQYWEEKYAEVNQYIFDIDGEIYTYTANKSKAGTENSRIVNMIRFRWYDSGINQTDLAFLRKLSKAGTAKISLINKTVNKSIATIILTSEEKKNIQRAIDYYFALDGAKIPKQGMVNIRQ